MRMNPDAFLTRAQAARMAGVAASTVGTWLDRGWVDPETGERRQLTVRRTAGGRLLYRLGDVVQAEADTFANPKSRRGRPVAA